MQFYFTSKSEIVKVEKVRSTVQRVDNAAVPGYSYEVDSELQLLTSYGARFPSETFFGFGTEQEAKAYAAWLIAFENQQTKMYISPHVPTHYAFELSFPWLRIAAMVVSFFVLILPPGLAIIFYFFERKCKA